MNCLRYTIAGVSAGLLVFFTLWVADRFNIMWAGLITSLPITLFVLLFFLSYEQLGPFSLYFAWGKFAYFISLLFVVMMIYYFALNKVAIGFLSFSIWLLVLGMIYWYFYTNGIPYHLVSYNKRNEDIL